MLFVMFELNNLNKVSSAAEIHGEIIFIWWEQNVFQYNNSFIYFI